MIYAHECAPYNRAASTIGAQRAYQFAKWLPEFGWNAIVLACDVKRRYSINPLSSWESSISDEVKQHLSNWDKNSSITIPLPSLQYDGIFDKWWLSSVEINSKGSFVPKPGKLLGIKRKVASLFKLKQGDYSQAWQKVAELAAQTVIKEINVSAQLACHGPDASVFVANKIAKTENIPWVVDFRDPVFQPHGMFQKPVIEKLFTGFSKSWSASINVNDVLSQMDETYFKKKAYTITNGYNEDEFNFKLDKNYLSEGEEVKLLYAGNIYYPKQKLTLFFELLSLLTSDKLNYKFYYYGDNGDLIKQYALKYDVLDSVKIKSSINREDVPKLLKSADIQVIFPMQEDAGGYYKDGLLPGKFFEYLGSKKPILCLSNMQTMLERTIRDLDAGLATSNLDEAKNWMYNLAGIEQANHLKREQFSRKSTTHKLANVLDNTQRI